MIKIWEWFKTLIEKIHQLNMPDDRVRPHITVKEAYCRCGCGLIQSDETLDWIDYFIEKCSFSLKITTSARCKVYNAKIGGVDDSPHKLTKKGKGAGDFANRNPKRRWKMIDVALKMAELGYINQIECCDRHMHLAKVPPSHRLAGCFNWGKSR